jgi:hypothetical protein
MDVSEESTTQLNNLEVGKVGLPPLFILNYSKRNRKGGGMPTFPTPRTLKVTYLLVAQAGF